MPAKAARAAQVMAGLKAAYPEAHCELDFRTPLELLVATILSAQCADKQVNRVTAILFAKYRTAADYAQADLAELEQELKSLGLYRNKAKNIRACCRKLVERHHGEVPASMDALIEMDGVGRKTANVVLGNAFHLTCGIVVDTHVMRLARRLGLSRHSTPDKIELELQRLAPPSEWTLLSHRLIWHGRRRCSARRPDCAHCEIRAFCPSAQ